MRFRIGDLVVARWSQCSAFYGGFVIGIENDKIEVLFAQDAMEKRINRSVVFGLIENYSKSTGRIQAQRSSLIAALFLRYPRHERIQLYHAFRLALSSTSLVCEQKIRVLIDRFRLIEQNNVAYANLMQLFLSEGTIDTRSSNAEFSNTSTQTSFNGAETSQSGSAASTSQGGQGDSDYAQALLMLNGAATRFKNVVNKKDEEIHQLKGQNDLLKSQNNRLTTENNRLVTANIELEKRVNEHEKENLWKTAKLSQFEFLVKNNRGEKEVQFYDKMKRIRLDVDTSEQPVAGVDNARNLRSITSTRTPTGASSSSVRAMRSSSRRISRLSAVSSRSPRV